MRAAWVLESFFGYFVWTGEYNSKMLRVDADFFIYGKKVYSTENIRTRVDVAKIK